MLMTDFSALYAKKSSVYFDKEGFNTRSVDAVNFEYMVKKCNYYIIFIKMNAL